MSQSSLNEKVLGRKSYERANLRLQITTKPPSKKKGNKRRKSFCARMKGMKKKLTCLRLQEILTQELISLLVNGTVLTNLIMVRLLVRLCSLQSEERRKC